MKQINDFKNEKNKPTTKPIQIYNNNKIQFTKSLMTLQTKITHVGYGEVARHNNPKTDAEHTFFLQVQKVLSRKLPVKSDSLQKLS